MRGPCAFFFSFVSLVSSAQASPIKIEVESASHDVQVHYQSTYLASDQVCRIPDDILYHRDRKSGQNLREILAADKYGIPTLSHSWIEARRKITFTWGGKKQSADESEVISWLPRGEYIHPEAVRQPGGNYDLAATERFLAGATTVPVMELLIASQRTRIEGLAVGWAQASQQAPIVRRPLLGAIPRRIAARQIHQEVSSGANTLNYFAHHPRLVVDRGKFQSIPVNEDTFLAVRSRARRLDGFSYSMFDGVQRKSLGDDFGTSNCHSTATDLLAGGISRHGVVGFVDFGVTRGYSAASLIYHQYAAHGPTYQLKKSVRDREQVEERSIAARVEGKKDVGACKCETAGKSCRLQLSSGSRYELTGACKNACAPGGGLAPLILAKCSELTITE